jgi:hypothetical protein
MNETHALRNVVTQLPIACHNRRPAGMQKDAGACKKMLAAHLAAHLLSHMFAWNCPLVKATKPICKDWC